MNKKGPEEIQTITKIGPISSGCRDRTGRAVRNIAKRTAVVDISVHDGYIPTLLFLCKQT